MVVSWVAIGEFEEAWTWGWGCLAWLRLRLRLRLGGGGGGGNDDIGLLLMVDALHGLGCRRGEGLSHFRRRIHG